MATGTVPKSPHMDFNIAKGSYKNNDYEASVSTLNAPPKGNDRKDPKQGTQSFGPNGTVLYGTGKAKYDQAGFVAELQNQSGEFDGPAGSGAFGGETRVLEARARWNLADDINPMDDGKINVGIDGQAQANLLRTDQGVDYKTPAVTYAGHDVLWAEAHANGGALVGAQVDGSVNLNLSFSADIGLKARVGVFAGALVRAEGEVRGYVGGASVGVHARGEAWAGGQAWAEANVGLKGVHASAGAFAGAAAGGAVGADVMGVGVEASGEVWAGAGAKASFDLSFSDGKIKIGAGAGAALGFGAAGGVDITIDTNRLASDGMALWNTGTGIADQAGRDAGRIVGDVYDAAAGFVEDAADAAGDASQATSDAAGDIVDGAEDVAEDVVDAVEDGADAASQAASDVWNWLTGG